MKRRGDLQFEHTNRPDVVVGWGWNQQGDVVGQATIEKPKAMGPMFRTMGPHIEEPSGQLRMPIKETPAKVSWALANKEGRAAAVPHQVIAALSEHYNLRPVADEDLSPEGSAMARSAARRGLITPHPKNPTMEANVSDIYPDKSTREGDIRADLEGSYRDAHMFRSTGVEKFSDQQMGRAAARVFARKPKPGQRKSQGTQGTLF